MRSLLILSLLTLTVSAAHDPGELEAFVESLARVLP